MVNFPPADFNNKVIGKGYCAWFFDLGGYGGGNISTTDEIGKFSQWTPLDYDQERCLCRFIANSGYGVPKCHLIDSRKVKDAVCMQDSIA